LLPINLKYENIDMKIKEKDIKKGHILSFQQSFLKKVWKYVTSKDKSHEALSKIFSTKSKSQSNTELEVLHTVIGQLIYLLFDQKIDLLEFDNLVSSKSINRNEFLTKVNSRVRIEVLQACSYYYLLRLERLPGPLTTIYVPPTLIESLFYSSVNKKNIKNIEKVHSGVIMGDQYLEGGKEILDKEFPLTEELMLTDMKITKPPRIGNKRSGGYVKKSA